MEAERYGTSPEKDESSAAPVGGLRSKKRTKSAYARVKEEGGREEGAPDEGSARPTTEEARPTRPVVRSRAGASGLRRRSPRVEPEEDPAADEVWHEFGAHGGAAVGRSADEADYDAGDEEYEDEDDFGRRSRRSSYAIGLLVLFVALGVVGFFAKQMYSGETPAAALPSGARETAPAASGAIGEAGNREEGAEPSIPSMASSPGDAIEETKLTVTQEDDGQGGLYVTIGDETWHGKITPEEGTEGEILELEGPTASNVKMNFRTKDPEAVVDHGSFGIYAPGGGLMYATVQRTKALGGEEAASQGTYTVIGTSGEYYSGSYSDSLPDPASDRVVRTYTVEEGLPAEAGTQPEGPEPDTFRVAYELPRLEEEKTRPLVPQLLGWHAPDGTKLEHIVAAPK